MSARGLKEEWSVARYISSIQQDGDSCGVFVLMVSFFIEIIFLHI